MPRTPKSTIDQPAIEPQPAAAESPPASPPAAPQPNLARWFRCIMSPWAARQDQQFTFFAVLRILYDMGGIGTPIHLNTIVTHVPRSHLDHALRHLRASRYIDFDCNNVTVLRIPETCFEAGEDIPLNVGYNPHARD